MKIYTKYLNCILCTLALMLGLFLLSNQSNAQSQGYKSPVWVLNISSTCNNCPGANWGNKTNAELLDSNYATVVLKQNGYCASGNCYYSKEFTPSDYYFSIPNNAIITGIEVQVKKKASADNAIIDNLVQLMNADTAVGNNYSLSGYWSSNNSSYFYGGSTDLWGYNWTPAMINSQNFGVWFKAENKSIATQTAYVDWIGITVYYSTTTTGLEAMVSSSSTNFGAHYDVSNSVLNLNTNFEDNIASSTLSVYNLLGKLQYQKELTNISKGNSLYTIKSIDLAPGIYMVEFNGGGKKMVKKVIVLK